MPYFPPNRPRLAVCVWPAAWLFTLLLTAATAGPLLAQQDTAPRATASAWTRQIMALAQAYTQANGAIQGIPEGLCKEFMLMQNSRGYWVGGLLKVNPATPDLDADLAELGVRVHTRAGHVWTFHAPLESLRPLLQVPGVRGVEVDKPLFPQTDIARALTGVDSLQQGIGLTRPLLGEGIFMGIHDIGFDYEHHAFLDSQGVSRVRTAWQQFDSTPGLNPPTGYTYGVELASPGDFSQLPTDFNNRTHGAHVAGIAAGSDYFGPGQLQGVAPKADLGFVSIAGDYEQFAAIRPSSTVDANAYLFNYADALGQPAVVNMSLGSHLGPHDGQSLMDQGFANLTGPGKILVGSLGNSGNDRRHLMHAFAGDTVTTYTEIRQHRFDAFRVSRSDLWGQPNQPFCVQVELVNASGAPQAALPWLCTDTDTLRQDTAQWVHGGDTTTVWLTATATNAAPDNGKPNCLVHAFTDSLTENEPELYLRLHLTAAGGLLHAWADGANANGLFNDGAAWNLPLGANPLNGDTDFLMGEVGGTGDSVISVAAYVGRVNWQDLSGGNQGIPTNELPGEIAFFSSWGPRVDSVMKPDITAPGYAVVSALSRFDSTYPASFLTQEVQHNGQSHYYIPLWGTSMSAPVVSGIIALLLEANPNLSVADVRRVLRQNAQVDGNTGAIPAGGSPRWGWGKVQAYPSLLAVADAALLDTTDSTNTSRLAAKGLQRLRPYPNPAPRGAWLQAEWPLVQPAPSTARWMDASGRVVETRLRQPSAQRIEVRASEQLAAGAYWLLVEHAQGLLFAPVQLTD